MWRSPAGPSPTADAFKSVASIDVLLVEYAGMMRTEKVRNSEDEALDIRLSLVEIARLQQDSWLTGAL